MSSKWILSATEIETFETCRRKWGYLYLDGIKPPQSPATELGKSVHKIIEKHLIGYPIDYESSEGQIASAGLRYLPKTLPKDNVEHAFVFIKDDHIFHGCIDFFERVGDQTWLIGDHKTSSSLSTTLSRDELKKNIQANIYAQWAFTEKGAEAVKLKWIYYRTKGKPQAKCVEAELKKHEASSFFEHLLSVATDIKEVVKIKPDSSALPKNTSACFKYGRCPFYATCKNSPAPQAKPLLSPINIEESFMASSFHLYVDCVPTKNDGNYQRTMELSELLEPVLNKIKTEKELSHYRLAGYGQHVGLIANYLREHLMKEAYDNSTAILSSAKTPEGCDTLQTLTSQAGLVVRGF
ncbi:hypothetical protein E6Q11_03760 [Candidatus Dojkabacteria bacterium]|uniref:PD-(D/E)XK endonuclease-like domain-containing protein n=1 Tax=Candidatus Dojkabacteria bacterium TaxID=2099670 RepID=A0A5C7J6A3_9BACT|nr:MAG: hypothetical protein E6Q11_03760 [Candidatus Dojkabacteria bacterium]